MKFNNPTKILIDRYGRRKKVRERERERGLIMSASSSTLNWPFRGSSLFFACLRLSPSLSLSLSFYLSHTWHTYYQFCLVWGQTLGFSLTLSVSFTHAKRTQFWIEWSPQIVWKFDSPSSFVSVFTFVDSFSLLLLTVFSVFFLVFCASHSLTQTN